jgi:hypothetical protein
MIDIKKILSSRTSVILFSIICGIGLASIFKVSCDSADCTVFKGPDLDFKKTKIIKYNEKCYEANENKMKCDDKKKTINV